MRGRLARAGLILGLALGAGLMLLWATGGLQAMEALLIERQRAVQNAMAGAVRRLRAGEAGALLALLSVCFAYGFFHAAGPGHGKILIGGYGVARRVGFARLALISLAASLAQAATAVALVYAGVLVLGWTRDRLVGLSDGALNAIGIAAVAAIGLWLFGRGLRGVVRQEIGPGRAHSDDPPHHHNPHDHAHHDHAPEHNHAHHAHDAGCGHAHGPTIDEMARATGWRDTLALIAGVAVRPCTGALFLLILTFQMGIGAAGVAGALAMGLGTATVTIAVAGLSVWAREGALASLPGGRLARTLPVIEMLAGATIAALSLTVLARML